MRSCTATFSPDLIDSDVDNSTDLEFTPSPEAATCKAEVEINGTVVEAGDVTPYEYNIQTLDYDIFTDVYGMSVGDTLTVKYFHSNDTLACQGSVTLVAPTP